MHACHWQLPGVFQGPDSAFAWSHIPCTKYRRPSHRASSTSGSGVTQSYDWLRDPARTSQPVLQHFSREHEATRLWQRSVGKLRQQLQGSLENHLWTAALVLAAGQEEEAASAGQRTGISLLYWKYSRDEDAGTAGHAISDSSSVWQYARRPSPTDSSRHVHLLVATHQQQQQQRREIVLLDEGKEAARVASRRGAAGTQEYRVHSFSVCPDMSLFAYTSTEEYIPAAGIRGLTYTLHVRYTASGAPAASPVYSATGPLAWVPSATLPHSTVAEVGGRQQGTTQQLLFTAAEGSQLQMMQIPAVQPKGSTLHSRHAVGPRTLLKYDAHHVLLLRHVSWQASGHEQSTGGQELQQDSGQQKGQAEIQEHVHQSRGHKKGQNWAPPPRLQSTHRLLPGLVQGRDRPAPMHPSHMVLVEAVDSALLARAAWAVLSRPGDSSNTAQGSGTEDDTAAGAASWPDVSVVCLSKPSRGQRIAVAPCTAPCGGLLAWIWDAEGAAAGKLSWCSPHQAQLQLADEHLPGTGRQEMATSRLVTSETSCHGGELETSLLSSSGPLVAVEHDLLRPRQGWLLQEVQLQGSHVLAVYRQVALRGPQQPSATQNLDTNGHSRGTLGSGVLGAAAAAATAWQALQEQQARLDEAVDGPSGSVGTQEGGILYGGTTHLRFEVYSLRAAAPGRQGGQPAGASPELAGHTPSPRLVLEAAQDVLLERHPLARIESLQWRRTAVGQGLGSAALWRHAVRLVTSAPCTPAVTLNLTLTPPAPAPGKGSNAQQPCVPASLSVPGVKYGTVHARSRDGTLVPVSLAMPVSPGELEPASHHLPPVVLRVYGAYGIPDDMRVAPVWQTLVEQGVTCGTVHVRGGGMHGPAWHEAGRGDLKVRGLEDLLAAAEHLIANKYCHPGRLCLVADSAGGWLAGAALSQRPDLFCAAVLTVPSLDVVTTFQQDPCPGDSAELGDARGDEAVRRAVLAWSPADNVPDPQVVLELWDRQRRLWPHMLVRVGLFDSRVPPWDPGRYVAKLKDALQAGEQAVVAHYCSSAPRQGPPAVPKPRILMQVKPCGHEGYDSPADDATLAAFLLEAINEVQA